MNQIRSRINALRRKMALEISVVRLRPLAEEYCQEWSVAATEGQPAPDDLAFIRKVGAKIRLPTFMAAHRYLNGASPKTSFPASSISWAPCFPGPPSAALLFFPTIPLPHQAPKAPKACNTADCISECCHDPKIQSPLSPWERVRVRGRQPANPPKWETMGGNERETKNIPPPAPTLEFQRLTGYIAPIRGLGP